MINKIRGTKGQVTVFIIIAILIVAGVVIYAIARGSFTGNNVPANLQPAYKSFLSCLEEKTSTGAGILESQGGYIYLPDFVPGSDYMPFSSQLNFLGNPIPYWYYVSGNGIPKEQVPTQSQMETQLEQFIEEKISNCDFSSYYNQGFEISLQQPIKASVTIKDNSIQTVLSANLELSYGNETAIVKNHDVTVDSQLGALYSTAKDVYNDEQKTLFLEEHAVDNLRNYAPVDGVEISCSPKIWNAEDVFNDLRKANEANTLALNNLGQKGDYFDVGVNSKFGVRFLNSENWSSTYEVNPSDGQLLIANPVGNQQGLGIIGFCYVPYHYVYNVRYPVLAQVYSNNFGETFQFPMAVVLENNNPRVSLNVTAVDQVSPQLCSYKNTPIQVTVQDTSGNPVKADISYECLGDSCYIGNTSSSGTLRENFPQCVNGYVVAKAAGFSDSKYLLSTVSEGSTTIIMDKLYTKNLQLKVDGVNYNGDAIVSLTSNDKTQTLVYPEQRTVELGEGQYDIEVYIYKNTSINAGATTAQQCINTPKPGLLGLIGLQEQKCFNLQIPSQIISNALSGGGKQSQYISESTLTNTNNLEINSKSLPDPTTLNNLQNNYVLFDKNGLEVTLS